MDTVKDPSKRLKHMPEEQEIPFQTLLDLIERELLKGVDDVKDMRLNESRKRQVKSRCQLLKAALGSARHYLRELENSLEEPRA